MGDGSLEVESDLVDVGGLDLDLLVTIQDTVLAQAIRRVLHAAECPDEATLGFQQSI